MDIKTIYRPKQPNKPALFKLNTYYWTDLLLVDSWIIFGIGFVYWMHLEGAFESLEFYYLSIGITMLIRLWPFVVTNSQVRNKNKKLIDSFDKEVIKYEKSLKEYYILKTRMEVELENNKKLEHQRTIEYERLNKRKFEEQRRVEVERQNRLELNRHNSLELIRQKKMDYNSQNLTNTEKQQPIVKTPEEELKVRIDKIKQGWRSQPASNIKDTSIIKKRDHQIDVEVNNTIRNYSGICAVIAIQPIPFADIFILTPTQIIMGKKIADLRGYKINENAIESIFKEISGVIGMGIIAQQLLIGAYKTVLPFLGGITTIPAVYGLTYGIGKVMDHYIIAKINDTDINKNEMEKIFKLSRAVGEREGISKEKEIYAKAKK